MQNTIRVIQYGLGPIGRAVARHVMERAGLELVGAVDVDPAKAGRDLGEVIGLDRLLGKTVVAELGALLATQPADLVLHTTSSYFDLFKSQILEILNSGLDIVSTAEELSFPWLAHADDAREVDAAAKRAGKTVLATGVNPGFLMDALPLSLTALCQKVEHIAVTRVIDASKRRGPFQAKIGAGMTAEAFHSKMEAGRMGHVGLPESMGMIFHTLGKELARYESRVEPLLAKTKIQTDYFEVPAGQVQGLKQTAHGFTPEGEFVTLTFIAALEVDREGDTVVIKGKPDLEVHLSGTNGDLATVAMVVNAVRRVRDAAPGLVTMRDLPIVTWW